MIPKQTLIAGVLAGIGASLCCVGPLLLLSQGLGGAWVANLTAFEPVRPLFMGLTLLFIGLSFHKLYLTKLACEPGTPCANDEAIRWQRFIFWGVTLPLLVLLAFAALSDTALAASRTVTLTVQNMTCAVCPITVKKALSQVLGVTRVSVDYAHKTATVQFDDTAATVDQLTEATQAAGYPSTLKENQ